MDGAGMIANLWDNTFRHSVGSVAGKPPTRIEYVRDRTEWNGTTLFVDGYAGPGTVRQVQSNRKIGWLHEPPCLHPADYDGVDWQGLDLVLTYYEPFLTHPKARLVPYGGVWIPRRWWAMHEKTKLCSMLYGTKHATEGHRLRPAVAEAVRDLGVEFYGPVEGQNLGYGWTAKLGAHMDYAFSIVIETCNEPNLFTEILLDCMAVGTIPILWGCPNYAAWFNMGGVLHFESIPQVHSLVEHLSMGLYEQMKSAAWDNLQRIGRYEITDDLVAEALG